MSSFKPFNAHFKDYWVRKLKISMIPKTEVEKGSVYFGDQSPTFTHMLQITSVCLCASDADKPFETHPDTQKKSLVKF